MVGETNISKKLNMRKGGKRTYRQQTKSAQGITSLDILGQSCYNPGAKEIAAQ